MLLWHGRFGFGMRNNGNGFDSMDAERNFYEFWIFISLYIFEYEMIAHTWYWTCFFKTPIDLLHFTVTPFVFAKVLLSLIFQVASIVVHVHSGAIMSVHHK